MSQTQDDAAAQREREESKEQEYSRATSHTGRVAWVAPQNVQVDDAVRRLTAMSPDKIILRIYSYKVEVHNLVSAEPVSSTAIDTRQMNAAARQIVDNYNGFELRRDHKRNPAEDKNSWSESCRPDAICATPVAFAMMSKKVSWEPSFIIVGNAGQLSEAMTALPVSVYPNVPTMFIGDTQQPGLKVNTSRSGQYRASSTKQRADSLLRRVEAAGHIDFQLPVNRRRHRKNKTAEGQ
ncbi:hypothetical protein ACHAQJ_008629 [Trichoderma viride]